MGTGFRGTYVIAWAQTRVDGAVPEADRAIEDSMIWRWTGEALSLDGPQGRLMLGASADQDFLHARAARSVRRLLQQPELSAAQAAAAEADPVLSDGFVVSDGQTFWDVVPVALEPGLAPILVFPGHVPPPNKDLSVIRGSALPCAEPSGTPGAVLCFTPGTRLRTEDGSIAVEDLSPGDRILTRDDGPQQVAWLGHRRMSGARLFAMPEQRPIRIRAGALGIDRPDEDLVVSPDHRVILKGSAPRDLWGEPEVLVRAGDLVGDRNVIIDRSLRQTWYIHLLLERHQVVWANNVETESFLPAPEDLGSLDSDQRDSLLRTMPDLADAATQPTPARRLVSHAEAAICLTGPLGRATRH